MTVMTCLPPWFEAVQARFNELENLQPGWDGDGGSTPTAAAMNDACQVLLLVQSGACPLPYISPTSAGGIEMTWVDDKGERIEIEVEGDATAMAFVRSVGFADREDTLPIAAVHFRYVTAALTRHAFE